MDEMLSPYRVLDLTDEKGWLCGKLLAHLGADVIKCEPPGGDPGRWTGPFVHDKPDPEHSLFWFEGNVGKRGVTLDVATETGKELLLEMVKTSHILVESYRPGYLASLGLGYDVLAGVNPRLVMVSITPYGQTGPKAQYHATDFTIWASTGVMYCAGDPDRAPNAVAVPQARIHGGLEATMAVLTALYYLRVTGEGQYVDVSMQASALDSLLDTPEIAAILGRDYTRCGISDFVTKVVQAYGLPCQDGWVAFYTLGGGLLASAEHLGRMRDWMVEEGKAPDWFAKLDFVHDYESAVIDQPFVDRVEAVLADFTRTKTKAELYTKALTNRLILAPIQNAPETWRDRQLEARGFWQWDDLGDMDGAVPHAGFCALFSETPMRLSRPAPRIGEHNREVFVGELGLPAAKFQDSGAADTL
jgi:crotonobetainyl-CoA:carnitine CoA-transferase CaiB-like acyl-CoA transferase